MSTPFALQTVLELMQARADKATLELARLIANERDARSKLTMLQQYRNEYADRFTQAAKAGLTPGAWNNYRDFLNRLDDAITAQTQAVAQQAGNTAAGQAHWRQQQKKLKAIDTLSERHRSKEDALEMRRDQKLQDEFASRFDATHTKDQ
ncbi:flagellar export protein FliJ [Propionivibrio dicarboxylicus]|uniref:Flagellar FliJ protein n=1 Tax=Propionivibrio dicarboxylicus TaxID=83767 RepID=A0A1G8HCZ5_9RHOO|nr:flagellar export protein FliJ [Propionivibrio dicarboxylicus]SDI04526.1 flagellar FliJ protein [Propionivibrio dicarboxylicus]